MKMKITQVFLPGQTYRFCTGTSELRRHDSSACYVGKDLSSYPDVYFASI